MDHPSPIKNWIHKHSPLKSRNKPLPPPPPEDSSPARKPGEPVSGNISPPKPKSTNKFLSLLKPKSHQTTASSPTNIHHQRTPIHKKTFRSAKGRTPDLRTVSEKISSLEAQLREAQQELNVIAATQQQTVYREGVEIDREIVQRQESLSQGGRFDGLVENLLDQSNPSLRPGTRRGPPDASRNAFLEYQQVEAAYEPVEVEKESPHARQLKRKRSEASWQEMQERIAEFQKLQQQQQQPENKKVKRTLDPPQHSHARRQKNEDASENPPPILCKAKSFISSEFIEEDEDEEEEEEEELTALPQIKPHSHYTRSSLTPISSLPSTVRAHHRTSTSPQKQTPKSIPTPTPSTNHNQYLPSNTSSTTTTQTPKQTTPSANENDTDDTGAAATASAAQRAKNRRTHIFVPGTSKRLSKVVEEFEWNDEEIF